MHIKETKTIPESLNNMRLDQALAKLYPEYSRAQWQSWIKGGSIQIDDQPITKPREKVLTDQLIQIDAVATEQGDWAAQDIPLEIIHEDDQIIVINKQPGLVVHPGAGNPDRTLVNALLYHYPELITLPRAGIVHRLDKDTSGLLVIARTLAAHNALTQAITNREIKREYQAIIHGDMISGNTIDEPIGRHPTHRTKMAVKNGGREAITHYRLIEKLPYFTHIKCQLESGRTHQIRVHMAHIGHPIVGDATYGYGNNIPGKLTAELRTYVQAFPRQALHAWRLTLLHPTTEKELSFEAPLPADLQTLLKTIKDA